MIILAFGANLPGPHGSPENNIQAALSLMPTIGVHVLGVSSIWITKPVPESDQPWYRNAVALVSSDLAPYDLLCAVKKLEADFGRIDSVRNAPRVLDIDLICYHDMVFDDVGLSLPHPRMHERGFVLYPMREVVPDSWRHPAFGATVHDLIDALPPSQKLTQPLKAAA